MERVELSKQHLSDTITSKDISTALMGLSWLSLIVSPWALIAVVLQLTGGIHLTAEHLFIATGLIFGGVPHLISCLKDSEEKYGHCF